MNLSKEMLEKAKIAKSGAEILALAKANSIEMTEEQANEYYAELHKSGELADGELDNVVGGCGPENEDEKPAPRNFNVNDKVLFKRTPASEYEYGYIRSFYKYEGDKKIYIIGLVKERAAVDGNRGEFYISEDLIYPLKL